MKRLVWALALVMLAGAATAQDFDTQARRCADGSADPDLRIGACNWLLQSDRVAEINFPGIYNNRGYAYFDKRQFDLSIADFDTSIRLEPNNPIAYNNRGRAYKNKRQYDRAFADYNAALRLAPDFAWAYNNRGVAYYDMRQYDRAIADYDTAIRLAPDHAGAYNNRGSAYKNKRQYDRAIADYDAAIRLAPDHAMAYNNLAWLLATARASRTRNGARAVELALRALSLDDGAEYHDTLAAAYAEARQFADAVREQERAIETARREGATNLTDWRDRVRLYRQGRAYRE